MSIDTKDILKKNPRGKQDKQPKKRNADKDGDESGKKGKKKQKKV